DATAAREGHDDPAVVRYGDRRLRARAAQPGVDLLGRREAAVDQPRYEDVVDPAHPLDVGHRPGAVARDVEVVERLDVRARTVDRLAGEVVAGHGGVSSGREDERREHGEEGEATMHGSPGWAGPGRRDATGERRESYGLVTMPSAPASSRKACAWA